MRPAPEPAAVRIAWTADGLTSARIVLAPVIGILAAEAASDVAAVTLGVAWVTDALDGRLARRTTAPTRLGEWDMAVDTLVGAALVAGVAIGGLAPAWISIAALAAFGVGYLVLRQAALGMALQGVGYGAFLWHLWSERRPSLLVPVAVALTIGVFGARKLLRVVVPEFLGGMWRALRLRRGSDLGLRDDVPE